MEQKSISERSQDEAGIAFDLQAHCNTEFKKIPQDAEDGLDQAQNIVVKYLEDNELQPKIFQMTVVGQQETGIVIMFTDHTLFHFEVEPDGVRLQSGHWIPDNPAAEALVEKMANDAPKRTEH